MEYFKVVLWMSLLLQFLSHKNSINYLMSPRVSGLSGDGEGRGRLVGAGGGRQSSGPSRSLSVPKGAGGGLSLDPSSLPPPLGCNPGLALAVAGREHN